MNNPNPATADEWWNANANSRQRGQLNVDKLMTKAGAQVTGLPMWSDYRDI